MSLVPDMSLEDVYQAAKRAMSLMLEKDIKGSGVNKRRMIATVCFTGEGAAQLLETWLENHLSSLDEDVLIRPVRIEKILRRDRHHRNRSRFLPRHSLHPGLGIAEAGRNLPAYQAA
jgi:transcriptional regulatory protein LevR